MLYSSVSYSHELNNFGYVGNSLFWIRVHEQCQLELILGADTQMDIFVFTGPHSVAVFSFLQLPSICVLFSHDAGFSGS
jgi:hypothetical protein